MSNEEKILGMLVSMQSEIKEVHEKLDDLIEAHDETRMSVNTILGWTEKVSAAVNFPLPRI